MATKYATVKSYIRGLVTQGRIKPGERIPSESELIETLKVSRNPVRRALAELAHEGLIFTIRGSGSYVKQVQAGDLVNIYCLLDTDNRRFESDLILGMKAAVDDHPSMNVHLILKKPGRNTREMIEVLNALDTSVPGGLVFLPILSEERSENRRLGAALRSLTSPHFAVVQIDRYVPEYEGNCIMTDHRAGARKMAEHLVANGHERIAVLYEHPENTSIALRFQGLGDVLGPLEKAIPPEHRVLLPGSRVGADAGAVLRRLIDDGVTCLFCFENQIAREVWLLARRLGVRIPEDLSLCTFDDHGFASGERSFITCVHQQLENIGSMSVEAVLRNLENPIVAPFQTLIAPKIAIRRSVAVLD